MARKLLDAVTAPTDGAETQIGGSQYYPTGLFQVSLTGGTTTVVLQGRVSKDAPWATIASVDTSGITAVATTPYMRARVPAPIGLGVTVSAWIQAGS